MAIVERAEVSLDLSTSLTRDSKELLLAFYYDCKFGVKRRGKSGKRCINQVLSSRLSSRETGFSATWLRLGST